MYFDLGYLETVHAEWPLLNVSEADDAIRHPVPWAQVSMAKKGLSQAPKA